MTGDHLSPSNERDGICKKKDKKIFANHRMINNLRQCDNEISIRRSLDPTLDSTVEELKNFNLRSGGWRRRRVDRETTPGSTVPL